MSGKSSVRAALALALALSVTTATRGTEMTSDADMQAMMERWQAACTPGPEHDRLAAFLGTFDTTTRMWAAGPDQPPMESKGVAETKWWAERRWLQTTSDGMMMGQPEQGLGLMGYDNFKKKYVSMWANSSTTALLTMEGGFDQSGKNLILYGLMDEPMTGEHDKTVKYVWRLADPDHLVFEIHDLPIGESNTKVVEISFDRRK